MEEVLQRGSEQEAERDGRMGREEMADSGFLMEEDVEVQLDSGFYMERASVSSGGEESDWFVTAEHRDYLIAGDEQSEGRGSQKEGEMEADTGSEENEETEAERGGAEVDDQTEEENMEGALDVCLWPVEQSGGHVRISLEEVQRYYRLSRCCRWLLCGR